MDGSVVVVLEREKKEDPIRSISCFRRTILMAVKCPPDQSWEGGREGSFID